MYRLGGIRDNRSEVQSGPLERMGSQVTVQYSL